MGTSSLLLRAFCLASSECATTGLAFNPPPLLLRTETLSFRGSHLLCRTFSAQVLHPREPADKTCATSKKKSLGSSWEEAGALFFSAKTSDAVPEKESVQRRSNGSKETDDGLDRKRDKDGKLSYTRNRERGSGMASSGNDHSFRQKQSSDIHDGRGRYVHHGSFREEFSGDKADGFRMYGRHGKNGGLREKFSDLVDEKQATSRNTGSGGFREKFSRAVEGKAVSWGVSKDGGFRRQFSDRLDMTDKPQGYGKQFSSSDRFQRGSLGRKGIDNLKADEGEQGYSRRMWGGRHKKGKLGSDRPEKHLQGRPNLHDVSEDADESEDFLEARDVERCSVNGRTMHLSGYGKNSHMHKDLQSAVDDDYDESEEEEEKQHEYDDVEYGQGKSGFKGDAFGERSLPLPNISGEVIYGVGPIYAALQVSRRDFYCLYVQKNLSIGGAAPSKKKDKKAFEWIIQTAIDRGLEVKEVPKHDLNMFVDNRPHQGLVLDASPLDLVRSSGLDPPLQENAKAPVWVALDEVTDPQNFGAILRSAYFLGAAGVVVCAKNSAPLSAVVSKASAGALEVMELRSCKNMMKFLEKSTENGWQVVGGSAAGDEVLPVKDLPRGLPTILVLGGEGKGLRTNVKRCCSQLVCVPGAVLVDPLKPALKATAENADLEKRESYSMEDFIAVDSLNVSVAAGILLHELIDNAAASTEFSKPAEVVSSDQPVHSLQEVVELDYEVCPQDASHEEQESVKALKVERV